jgi:hypothetical protein
MDVEKASEIASNLKRKTMPEDFLSRVKEMPQEHRDDADPPVATARWGWRYHHLGVPTDIQRPGETYLPAFKFYVIGFDTSPFGIEWMRFEADCPLPEIIRTVPHLAFEVDDLDAALVGKQVLTAPNSPSNGVRAAMIIDDGALVELLEFSREAPLK